jgi:hypothetical protein
MSSYEPIRQAIKDYSRAIAQDLSEIRFWEVDRIQASLYAKIFLALRECISLQSVDVERKRASLAREYSNPQTSKTRKLEIQSELSEVKIALKEHMRLRSRLNAENEKIILVRWLKDNGYGEVFEEFLKADMLPQVSSIKDLTKI